MTDVERNRARSGPISSDSVRWVLDEWLSDVDEVDPLRVAVARRLADELDTPDLPAYVLARIVTALLDVVDNIVVGAGGETARPTRLAGGSRPDVHRLLRDVR